MDQKRFFSSMLALIFVGMVVYAWPGYAQVSKPITTSDGESPGTRVEVQELKRSSGGTVTLKFTMINDSNGQLETGSRFGESGQNKDFRSIGGITLIDPVSKKKYLVVRDSEGNCICSVGIPDINSKSRSNLWAKFPAPPQDVKKVSIVIPHFIPMDDVPIGE